MHQASTVAIFKDFHTFASNRYISFLSSLLNLLLVGCLTTLGITSLLHVVWKTWPVMWPGTCLKSSLRGNACDLFTLCAKQKKSFDKAIVTNTPLHSEKAVPYRYNAVEVENGKEVCLPSSSVVNIADVSGLTRSGRVFSAPPKPQINADFVERPIGNAVNSPNPALAVKPSSVLKTPTFVGPSGNVKEDCDEMMRLIKRSEYNVVDQLLQTPSKISVLSLLLNSEPHREALQKVLDVAYVDHDVTLE
ncbi:hypothetical protein KIW84_012837 [Lathyrus oleraceus]|uniref:Uncharacterized protein n=1 Tax=Pisum sativum TaxID=3888 RepID=A0A9D5BIR6_PEA|nr:hypothetical protein KIW84_012837 [Pisum sativum]